MFDVAICRNAAGCSTFSDEFLLFCHLFCFAWAIFIWIFIDNMALMTFIEWLDDDKLNRGGCHCDEAMHTIYCVCSMWSVKKKKCFISMIIIGDKRTYLFVQHVCVKNLIISFIIKSSRLKEATGSHFNSKHQWKLSYAVISIGNGKDWIPIKWQRYRFLIYVRMVYANWENRDMFVHFDLFINSGTQLNGEREKKQHTIDGKFRSLWDKPLCL